jgi:4-amino-4-deoxy-L-arabinose transferase-like glycosyltransferase
MVERLWSIVYHRLAPEWLILALALVVRCWRLSYHSIWFDEAVSLQWASSAPGWTWQKTISLLEDKHPPLYYLGLHYWLELLQPLGLAKDDAALRLSGSLLGVLTVAGVLLLVRRLSGESSARLAGLLVALSPLLTWYSQELRMFQPATTGLVWAGYCLLRAWESGSQWQRWVWWLAFVTVMQTALYSYLFSAFLLPAAGCTWLWLWLTTSRPGLGKRQWPTLLEGALLLAATALLFLPLAYNAWGISADQGSPGVAFAHLDKNLVRWQRVFTIWRVGWPEAMGNLGVGFFAILTLLGLLAPGHSHTDQSLAALDRAWLLLWIGLPLLMGNLLLARSDSVFAEDRYFLFLAPFVLWAVARGVLVLRQTRRWLAWSSGAGAVGLLALALPTLWTPAMYRENWRAAAHYVAAYQQASPGLSAALVAHIDYTRRPLEHYLRPLLSKERLPLFFPFGGLLSPEQIETVVAPPLQGIVEQGMATLWLTQSHLEGVDDQRVVEGWLEQRFALVTEQFPSGIKVSGYALQSRWSTLPPLASSARYPQRELAPGLQLAACELLTPQLAARDDQLHPPSGWVHVRLWWQTISPLDDDYIATAQVVGAEGVWGERLYRENEPLRRWPTHTWSPGEIMRDEVDINLNPLTPDNDYPILIGVMNGAGQPVGERVECGRVQVRG